MKQNKYGVYIHSNAIVDSVQIGKSTRVWAYTHILENAVVGSNCNICDFVFIENDVVIGDNVTVKSGVQLWDGLRVENDVFIGPNVTFVNDIYPRSKSYLDEFPETILEKGASIGANSVILAGKTIGKYAMVGAGSVVTKTVNDFQLVFGNPATHKGFICKCGLPVDPKIILNNHYSCSCGSQYNIDMFEMCPA